MTSAFTGNLDVLETVLFKKSSEILDISNDNDNERLKNLLRELLEKNSSLTKQCEDLNNLLQKTNEQLREEQEKNSFLVTLNQNLLIDQEKTAKNCQDLHKLLKKTNVKKRSFR